MPTTVLIFSYAPHCACQVVTTYRTSDKVSVILDSVNSSDHSDYLDAVLWLDLSCRILFQGEGGIYH